MLRSVIHLASTTAKELLEQTAILVIAPTALVIQYVVRPDHTRYYHSKGTDKFNQVDALEDDGEIDLDPKDLLQQIKGDPKRCKPKRRMRGHFAAQAATSARLHFGGLMPYSSSNSFAVRKHIAEFCKERGVVNSHALKIVDEATIAFFTPRQQDIQSMLLANHPSLCLKRSIYREVCTIRSVKSELLARPLAPDAWARAYRRVRGFPDWEAFAPVK